jgi:xanthine dehydrogenase small subunit
MLRFALNDKMVEVEANSGLPALDYLRNEAGLTGVKHACREGDCGSCVVLLGQRERDEVPGGHLVPAADRRA